MEEALSQVGASPKMPFTLCNTADHNLNDLYHLSIKKVTQHKKIGLAIVSKLVTLGEGGGDQPPPPCMDQFINC